MVRRRRDSGGCVRGRGGGRVLGSPGPENEIRPDTGPEWKGEGSDVEVRGLELWIFRECRKGLGFSLNTGPVPVTDPRGVEGRVPKGTTCHLRILIPRTVRQVSMSPPTLVRGSPEGKRVTSHPTHPVKCRCVDPWSRPSEVYRPKPTPSWMGPHRREDRFFARVLYPGSTTRSRQRDPSILLKQGVPRLGRGQYLNLCRSDPTTFTRERRVRRSRRVERNRSVVGDPQSPDKCPKYRLEA